MSQQLRRLLKFCVRSIWLGLLAWITTETFVTLSNSLVKPPHWALENQLADLAFQVRVSNPRFNLVTTDDVVIIDIDDVSIEHLGRPQLWPRLYDARAIAHVASGNPAAIGIDYLYTEADSLLPIHGELLKRAGVAQHKDALNALRTDDTLAHVIAEAQVVYLSMFDDDANDPGETVEISRVLIADNEALPSAPVMRNPRLPITLLNKAAQATGTIVMPSEFDGTVRHYQALSRLSETTFTANFPVFMAIDAYAFNDDELHVRPDGLYAIDQRFIPLNTNGQFRINWGGADDQVRYISFYKVIEGLIPPEFFSGKFVFFGTSASGMQDLKTVPYRIDKLPGVEVHAHAFLTMINGAWFTEITTDQARYWFLALSVILTGLMLVLRPLAGFLAALVLIAGEALYFVMVLVPVKATVVPIASLFLLTLLSYIYAALYIYFVRERRVRKLRSAFSSYVPPEVVRRIVAEGRAVQLGGQSKHLTVLFSDIRGFTSYSERLEPEAVVSFLNDYLNAMTDAIFKHSGTIDKFIGDAIMAIFGAPMHLNNHATLACAAALEMRAALKTFNIELSEKQRDSVAMGIGINTGEMTVGNIGSRQRFNYTVIGDSVNVAARLESLTKFFNVDILVTADTMQACTPSKFVFRLMGRVKLQGRAAFTEVYGLVGRMEDTYTGVNLNTWHEALEHLFHNRLDQASNLFESIANEVPDDLATRRCLELISRLRTEGGEPVFAPSK